MIDKIIDTNKLFLKGKNKFKITLSIFEPSKGIIGSKLNINNE